MNFPKGSYLFAGTVAIVVLLICLAAAQPFLVGGGSSGQSGELSLRVTGILRDFNAPEGTVLYVLSVSAVGPPNQSLFPSSFYVKSNSSNVYFAFEQLGGSQSYFESPLGYGLQVETLTLDAGGLGSGQLVFQLPRNQTPVELGYQSVGPCGLGAGCQQWPKVPAETTLLPKSSTWSSVLVTGLMVDVESPQGTPMVSVDGWIENNSVAYSAGDSMTANLFVYCAASSTSYNGAVVTVNSTSVSAVTVNASTGFELVSLKPSVPALIAPCLGGETYGASFAATVVAPSSSYSGPLELEVEEQQELFHGPAFVTVSGNITWTGAMAGVLPTTMTWGYANGNVVNATVSKGSGVSSYEYSVVLRNAETYGFSVGSTADLFSCSPEPLSLYSSTSHFTFDITC